MECRSKILAGDKKKKKTKQKEHGALRMGEIDFAWGTAHLRENALDLRTFVLKVRMEK